MRVYLPCTLPKLAALLRAGQLGPAPVRGYAVTPALREWYSSGDQEELEYAAMAQAAKASLRLLQADPQAPPRRVVVAAELPDQIITDVAGFDEPALVEVAAPVAVALMVSGHVDDPYAAGDIKAAIGALTAADSGDDDARFTVDSAEGHELLWYATQELQHVAR
ncbi:MAG TPA: hypothetical protein VH637_07370 [Streptosporangiaceae bacterium]|jgi:hypothetical protein